MHVSAGQVVRTCAASPRASRRGLPQNFNGISMRIYVCVNRVSPRFSNTVIP